MDTVCRKEGYRKKGKMIVKRCGERRAEGMKGEAFEVDVEVYKKNLAGNLLTWTLQLKSVE